MNEENSNWLTLTSAAALAIFVGIGLSRFAYSPFIPILISEGWFTSAQTAYLGAANLAGYLFGALLGQQFAMRWETKNALRIAMLAATTAFFASATPISFLWFFTWRFVSGLTGGTLMVLAATSVLPFVPETKRGLASGLIFTGVGSGIVLSGTLVPALVDAGLAIIWCALGLLSLIATACAWKWWPSEASASPAAAAVRNPHGGAFPHRQLIIVYLIYGLVAVGLVPHMVFFVDFIARGLSQGLDAGGWYWVVFGVGALGGPILAGRLADAIGVARALRCALFSQALCVALPVFAASPIALIASSLVVGGAVSGTVPLILGRTREIVSDPLDRRTAWSIATIVFALGQAIAGYVFSYLFASSGEHYPTLFTVGAAALGVALIVACTPFGSFRQGPQQALIRHQRAKPTGHPPNDVQ